MALMRDHRRIDFHGTKFETFEGTAQVTDAILLEQRGTARDHFDGDDSHQRCDQRQRHADANQIQKAFPERYGSRLLDKSRDGDGLLFHRDFQPYLPVDGSDTPTDTPTGVAPRMTARWPSLTATVRTKLFRISSRNCS